MMKKLLIHTSKYIMKFLVRIIIISTFFLFSCDEISEVGIRQFFKENDVSQEEQNQLSDVVEMVL